MFEFHSNHLSACLRACESLRTISNTAEDPRASARGFAGEPTLVVGTARLVPDRASTTVKVSVLAFVGGCGATGVRPLAEEEGGATRTEQFWCWSWPGRAGAGSARSG